jgi:hypothetical protein
MGTFGGYPQKAQSLRLDVQIETRQSRSFPHFNHHFTAAFRENIGTLLNALDKSTCSSSLILLFFFATSASSALLR